MNKRKSIIIVISVICSLLVLLYLSTYIPQKSIKKNVEKSANILYKQKDSFTKYSFGRKVLFNNHTDALMINLTYSIDPNKKLESILINKRNYNPKVTTKVVKESTGDLLYNYKHYSMTTELFQTVNNKNIISYEYIKYWHGYIILIKPLLLFFDITGIRILITLMILISLFYLCFLIYKETDWKTSLAVLIPFLSINIFTTSLNNIQGMFVFLIAIISSIVVFKKNLSDNSFYLLLIINGILTAFFDFLTTPIIPLLIPIIIRNIKDTKSKDRKQILIYYSKCFLVFFISYFAFWFLKWLIVDIIYHKNVIKIAFEEILIRSGIKKEAFFLESIYMNSFASMNILAIIIFCTYIINYKKVTNIKNYIYSLSILAVVIWFLITKQHAFQHFFYTYRNFVVIFLAMTLTIVSDNRKNKKMKKAKK